MLSEIWVLTAMISGIIEVEVKDNKVKSKVERVD